MRLFTRLEIASEAAAVALAVLAFFVHLAGISLAATLAVAFGAALAAAISATLLVARVVLEEIEPRRF